MCLSSLRIGNGGGKQGCGNRPPIDDRNPKRKFCFAFKATTKLGLNWLATAENQREKPIRNFSIDPASSKRLVAPSTGWMQYYLCFSPQPLYHPLCDRETPPKKPYDENIAHADPCRSARISADLSLRLFMLCRNYHSFRNHDIFNSKTITSSNCDCRQFLTIPEGNSFLQLHPAKRTTVTAMQTNLKDPWKL